MSNTGLIILHNCPKCSHPYLSGFDGKEEAKQQYIAGQRYAWFCAGNRAEETCHPAVVHAAPLPDAVQMGRMNYEAWLNHRPHDPIGWDELSEGERSRWTAAATVVARIALANSGQVSINEARASVGLPPIEGVRL